MLNMIWCVWLYLSRQKYPDFRGRLLRNPFGRTYAYEPEEMYPAWTRNGEFVNYGTWPPLMGRV